jgi:hypothetical protein
MGTIPIKEEFVNVRKIGPGKLDVEIGRIIRYEEWCSSIGQSP